MKLRIRHSLFTIRHSPFAIRYSPFAIRLIPYLSLNLLTCVAGMALLSAHGPDGYDIAFHFWRAVQAERLLRAGILLPRWAPDMAWGYGYPLFTFQGALSAQLAAALHIVGLPWTAAYYGAYLLALLASAWTLYLLARALWGEVGGWGSAACFLFIPFHLFVLLYRASLAETLAWVFPPLVLWGLIRWGEGCRRGLLIGAAALAALPLAHPVSLYLFLPLFGVWTLAEIVHATPAQRRPIALRLASLLTLGLALGAFAWAPGLAERAYVQLERSTNIWVFDYRHNFLTLDQLLPWPRNADPRLLNDWPALGLGALFLLTGCAGLVWAWRARRAERARWLALGVACAACLFLTLPASLLLWERLPFLASFQFPWRFLSPASLALTLLCGGFIAALAQKTKHAWGALALVAALILAHAGWLYPPRTPLPGPANVAGMLAWEQLSDTIGTTATRELLPVWVLDAPTWDNPLRDALARGEEPARFDAATLPPGGTLLAAEYRPLRAALTVDSPQPFTARWLAFYYPGWQVRVDGKPVAVAPEPETGLVTFPFPAGQHRIEVWFGETPLRRVLNAVSLGALVALLLLCFFYRTTGDWRKVNGAWRMANSEQFSILILSILLLLLVWFAEPLGLPFRRTRLQPDGTLRGVATPLAANFGNRVAFIGAELPPAQFPADAAPEIRLYARALDTGGRRWLPGLSLRGPDGSRWLPDGLRTVRVERAPPPVPAWPADRYALWAHHLDVLPGTPPGTYQLELSLFDQDTLEPASLLGPDGNPLAPVFALGTFTVTRPTSPSTLAALGVPDNAEPVTCGALQLWDFTADRVQAAPGEIVGLRWVWEALDDPGEALTVTLSLYAASPLIGGTEGGRTWDLPPAAVWWLTDQWQTGDRWVSRPVLRLPGGLESGEYMLELALRPALVAGGGVRQAHPLAPELVEGIPGCAALARVPLTIVAPERAWELPPGLTPLDAVFGGQARLAGYAIEWGDELRVTLAWQAVVEMTESYRVFAHLVDSDGRVVAQSDGEPAAWTRPTTGWAVGEVVTETRLLPFPLVGETEGGGAYTLRVGLYLPDGPRLLLSDGQDALVIAVKDFP